jgi:hypothetical protein
MRTIVARNDTIRRGARTESALFPLVKATTK